MASFTGVKAKELSAAMLTDPKALKKHLANGTPISSYPESSPLPAPRNSELAHSEPAVGTSLVPDILSQRSKDEAYHILENEGNKAMISQNATTAGQAASSTLDPRRLLDPKGFNNAQWQSDPKSSSTESTLAQPGPPNLQLTGQSSKANNKPSETQSNFKGTNVDGLYKRDHEDFDGLGMGSLIEKVHNVSQREERPRKKPKVENGEFEVEEDKKFAFNGGGKGGEIGDYLKEQKKQGIAGSGSVNAVVDLTGGT